MKKGRFRLFLLTWAAGMPIAVVLGFGMIWADIPWSPKNSMIFGAVAGTLMSIVGVLINRRLKLVE